jgi:hypothetical protein
MFSITLEFVLVFLVVGVPYVYLSGVSVLWKKWCGDEKFWMLDLRFSRFFLWQS